MSSASNNSIAVPGECVMRHFKVNGDELRSVFGLQLSKIDSEIVDCRKGKGR